MRHLVPAAFLCYLAMAGLPSSAAAQGESAGGVDVTPDGTADPLRLPNSGYTTSFSVENSGTFSYLFTLICGYTGLVTGCSLDSDEITIGAGATVNVNVQYTTGASGSGTVTLTASRPGASDDGYRTVALLPPPGVTLVAPVLTSGSRAVVRSREPVVRALFTASQGTLDTTKTRLVWQRAGQAAETVTVTARHNRGLVEWQPDSARGIAAVGDSALTTVKACYTTGACTTVSRWAVLPNDSTPVLGFSAVPVGSLAAGFASPFGPGLSVANGETETGFSTIPYFSMGSARSAGLVYSTRQSYPRVLVPLDVELPWPAGTPTQLKVVVMDGATRKDSTVVSNPTCTTGAVKRCRTVVQADFASSTFSTPTRKWLKVEVSVTASAVTRSSVDSVEAVLVDRRSTMYGSGWWPAGAFKLVVAGSDRLLVGSSGATTVFRGNGDSLYLAAPGSFVTLKKTASGWDLLSRGSIGRVTFDSQGRLRAAIDANGNADSVFYSGTTDTVTSLKDPVGKTITFAYTSGKLATITALSAGAARQTKVTINGSNQLTYDSLSSPTSRPYTTKYVYQSYPGTNTSVLIKRIGVITDTTIVTYDSTFLRRPVLVRLPQVQDETGVNVNPVIAYTARERRGYHAFMSLDSAWVEMKDPRNHWTRSLLNRWGQTRKSWDTLGVLSRAAHDGDGLVLWAEGKVADSTRTYFVYDQLRRSVKSYIIRAAGDTLRGDSVVYDASHRVVKRINNRGQADSIAYDANGNVIQTRDPAGNLTKFWYRSDGLLDSTRAPNTTVSTRYEYDATWKQGSASYVGAGTGTLLGKATYDSYGRAETSTTKTRVQETSSTTKWQWRRTMTFYTIANQADSTVLARTDNCDDPCTSPPAFGTDTLHTERVGWRFDRAGRDSVRLNSRGKASVNLFDRLGRLRVRLPWADSGPVMDSLFYDVAGNIKKTRTRRGHVITADYDSRNRDTLAVIPGVGTVRKQYSGPLDQLSRLWIASPVDSIGGVNGELRWGYDQGGRGKADTSYTGATARATTYTYDRYERDSTRTDPLGTWTTRYDATRGLPEKLITPFGDSLVHNFGPAGELSGPNVWAGGAGAKMYRIMDYDGSKLVGLSHTIGGSGWEGGKFDAVGQTWDEDGNNPPLGPVWTHQNGAAAAMDSLRDSVRYDGWGRVTLWQLLKKTGAKFFPVALDTFAFDASGNLRTASGTEAYDATTDRLLSRTEQATPWFYQYDRAGNLVRAQRYLADTSQVTADFQYDYDALNQLRSVRLDGTLIARYGYDALGRRIAKRVYSSSSGGAVEYLRMSYVRHNVSFEADSGGTIGLRYTWGPGSDNLVGVRTAAVADSQYYAVVDKLGSVRGLVRKDGAWLMSQRFRPYGALQVRDTASAFPRLRYQWTGREYDAETGWYFHRSRYYDPAARRFVQEDRIGYRGGRNVYAYLDGQVLEGRDPSGQGYDADLMKEIYERMSEYLAGQSELYQGRGGSNRSYIPDDGYFQALMDDLADIAKGSRGCGRVVCASGPEPGVEFGGSGEFNGGGAGRSFGGEDQTFAIAYDWSHPSTQKIRNKKDKYHSAWGTKFDYDIVSGADNVSSPNSRGEVTFCRNGSLDLRNGSGPVQGRYEIGGWMEKLGTLTIVNVTHHFFRPGRTC